MSLGFGERHKDSGMFHVTLDPEGPGVIRLHLRRPGKKLWDFFGKSKPSMLWINGTQLLLLEDSAADIVQALIETVQDKTARKSFTYLACNQKRDCPSSPWPLSENIHLQSRRILIISTDPQWNRPKDVSTGKGVGERLSWQEWQAPGWIFDLIYAGSGYKMRAMVLCVGYAGDPELDTASWKKVLDCYGKPVSPT